VGRKRSSGRMKEGRTEEKERREKDGSRSCTHVCSALHSLCPVGSRDKKQVTTSGCQPVNGETISIIANLSQFSRAQLQGPTRYKGHYPLLPSSLSS